MCRAELGVVVEPLALGLVRRELAVPFHLDFTAAWLGGEDLVVRDAGEPRREVGGVADLDPVAEQVVDHRGARGGWRRWLMLTAQLQDVGGHRMLGTEPAAGEAGAGDGFPADVARVRGLTRSRKPGSTAGSGWWFTPR